MFSTQECRLLFGVDDMCHMCHMCVGGVGHVIDAQIEKMILVFNERMDVIEGKRMLSSIFIIHSPSTSTWMPQLTPIVGWIS
jgi:hypothetical protein